MEEEFLEQRCALAKALEQDMIWLIWKQQGGQFGQSAVMGGGEEKDLSPESKEWPRSPRAYGCRGPLEGVEQKNDMIVWVLPRLFSCCD